MKYIRPFKINESQFDKPEAKYPVNYKCVDIMSVMYELEKNHGIQLTGIPAKGSKYGTMDFFRWCGKNLNPIFPKYTMGEHHYELDKKRYAGTGIPLTRMEYFERSAVYEIPIRYDSSNDLEIWTKRRDDFRANMTKMAKMSGNNYNIDNEKHIDFGPKSNEWVNVALDKIYELNKQYYKNGKLLIWNDDDQYPQHKQQYDYPMDKAYFLSEIENWVEDTFNIDADGFYDWILNCQFVEGRYWENTWTYDLEDVNFRKKKAPDNVKKINEVLRQIYKLESMDIFIDYFKEVDVRD